MAQDMEESAPAAAAPDAASPATIEFEHRFFGSFPDLFFRMSEGRREPLAVIRLGAGDAALNFRSIKSEFSIAAESPDGRMLALVEESLAFVNAIRPGDPVPKEVLTDDAPWEPSEAHKQTAFHRVTVQLATWSMGCEAVITDPEQLLRLTEDPATKQRIVAAFDQAAAELGLEPARKAEVIDLVKAFGAELAYVEALRDRTRGIGAIAEKVDAFRKLNSHSKSILTATEPVARMIGAASEDFARRFETVDGQTGEIISAIKNFESRVGLIRKARDGLFRRLNAWTPIFGAWQHAVVERSRTFEDLIDRTFKFLAPRFMTVQEWQSAVRPAAVRAATTNVRKFSWSENRTDARHVWR
jgi:hypothetical protein